LSGHEIPKHKEGELATICLLLRKATGVDFSLYKEGTLQRRIRTRMAQHKIQELKDYVEFIQGDSEEGQALFEDLLIRVTRFFRDRETFDTLKANVFPRLMENRSPDDSIRVWIPGCSTGEEVYSIAMCLLESLGDMARSTPIKIFATDISESAINRARSGVYPENISADVSPERLRRFFAAVGTGYKVAKTVRDSCVFAKQDVTKDPPFSNLDFLSCRNVLIYFEPVLQQQVMPIFHYALKPGAFLMLGVSETIGQCSELFKLVDKKNRIYSKKPSPSPRMFGFPLETHAEAPVREGECVDEKDASTTDIQKEADRVVVGKYAPPGVVIDGDRNAIQFRGDTGAFLKPAPGAPTFDVLKMAREGIRLELHKAINEALEQGGSVRKEGLRVKTNEHFTSLNLEVVPLGLRYAGKPCLLITFEHDDRRRGTKDRKDSSHVWAWLQSLVRRSAQPRKGTGGNRRVANGPTMEELGKELEDTKNYLQSIIDELDARNEELQAANEEIRSANEELQSTNEELETAKEELQATNEELTTVNEELQGRNAEIGKINDDLTNLVSSVNIPIVMLGPDLSIRRFTPSAGKVFNFVPGDIGRPIADIKSTIDVADLDRWVLEVLKDLTVKEAEVKDREGHWYTLTLRPYRTVANKIDGAVIALVDIDKIKRSEGRVRESLEYAENIIETVRQPLLVLDKELRVQKANRAFCKTFKVSSDEVVGPCIYELGNRQWDIPDLRRFLEEIITQNTSFEGYEVEHDFPTIGHKTMLLNARRMRGQRGTELILLALEECRQSQRLAAIGETVTGLAHESRNALQRAQAGLERLESRLTGNPEASAILDQIQKAQDDLHRLYDDVREYAAPMPLEKDACDLAKLVEDAWLDLASMREGREARIQQHSGGLALHRSFATPLRTLLRLQAGLSRSRSVTLRQRFGGNPPSAWQYVTTVRALRPKGGRRSSRLFTRQRVAERE
jgi:two-component system CheB/CheR fusion protein